ncbi:MAG: tetratricopeptide repeat protein, partial [Ktedonobacteraceae bacterium]|nr:tetratricopeptide repeat protein [Ktedonobacteraceae bacterium]
CSKAGLNTLRFEIIGSPEFHHLHWEALKDPKLPQPFALQAPMARQNVTPQVMPAGARPSPTINLLIVTARPRGRWDVGYRTISQPLVEELRRADLRVKIDILRPGTYMALDQHLRETTNQHGAGYYHVLHFDVHGALLTYKQVQELLARKEPDTSPYLYHQQRYGREDIQPYDGYKAFLSLEHEREERADFVEAAELSNLLLAHQVPVVILNACQSGKQVGASETSLGNQLMRAGIQVVLAMGYSVTVSAAEVLMRTLYQQLFAGRDLSTAICQARVELQRHKGRRVPYNQLIDLEDWLLPVVYQNQPQRLAVRDFETPQERTTYHESLAARYREPATNYGFVGRDLDILQIEKHLLARRNIVLVRGMGGAGKTTLLHHLASWWQTTGLVEQVFYFGYNERAWTRQQIMTQIAKRLLSEWAYLRDFQPLSPDAQQDMLTQKLRASRHLLILDNMESITGARLAIQHTLSKKEQAALHRFVTDLAAGRTLVVLGSRGGEDWLAKGTFEDNVYDLPGLDPEAASMLAEHILKRHNALKYREDTDLRKLLKLLDGFPLALEVVLSNLERQTPKEVLDALQAGDVSLDPKASSQEKTESILRCIEYSYSNLSPEAQQLLACLAPFTSVIWIALLEKYTDGLKQQLVLATLPFERWPQVVQEAKNWGLLSPDPDIPTYLHIQPTLPYFLYNRLNLPEQAEIRHAIEVAFREHYDGLGSEISNLFKSKDSQDRLAGRALAGLEYENLVTALKLALTAQVSIAHPYFAISEYLDTTQDHQRGLELAQNVANRLQAYPTEKLSGPLGVEYISVIDNIGLRQLYLNEFEAAESSYLKALSMLHEISVLDTETKRQRSGSIYHQLGAVAQEQRHRSQAEAYYQQALQIFIDFDDRYKQASTYHQLGRVAQEQRHWTQAEDYFQHALQIYIDFNDRYEQAGTYHHLGMVAQEQRHWTQAEDYFQHALQIFIDFDDRHSQASTYHHLGMVAQEQRHWPQAEDYFQQALQITIDFDDRYSQASTYQALGVVAREQQQWPQSRAYLLQALEIFTAYQDTYSSGNALYSLALLWQVRGDTTLPVAIAPIMKITADEAEALLRQQLGKQKD